MLSDSELADQIIARLNELIRDPKIRHDVGQLIETRVVVGEQTAAHSAIQVQHNAEGDNTLGFLGMLNGVIGIIPDGKLHGWGYVAAVFNDAHELERFRRTDAEKSPDYPPGSSAAKRVEMQRSAKQQTK